MYFLKVQLFYLNCLTKLINPTHFKRIRSQFLIKRYRTMLRLCVSVQVITVLELSTLFDLEPPTRLHIIHHVCNQAFIFRIRNCNILNKALLFLLIFEFCLNNLVFLLFPKYFRFHFLYGMLKLFSLTSGYGRPRFSYKAFSNYPS